MNTSSQTPITPPAPRVLPLHVAPLPVPVFVDRDGDEWHPAGHAPSGVLLLACPQPSNPEDQGVGESFAWTLPLVEAQFGPLTSRLGVSA